MYERNVKKRSIFPAIACMYLLTVDKRDELKVFCPFFKDY